MGNIAGLFYWYTRHLLDDFMLNRNDPKEIERIKEEAKRLGCIIDKPFDFKSYSIFADDGDFRAIHTYLE
jgi:hypothetical protein